MAIDSFIEQQSERVKAEKLSEEQLKEAWKIAASIMEAQPDSLGPNDKTKYHLTRTIGTEQGHFVALEQKPLSEQSGVRYYTLKVTVEDKLVDFARIDKSKAGINYLNAEFGPGIPVEQADSEVVAVLQELKASLDYIASEPHLRDL